MILFFFAVCNFVRVPHGLVFGYEAGKSVFCVLKSMYMKRYFPFLLLFLLPFSVSAQKRAKFKKETFARISAAMQEQEDCWNRGDIPCFMKHYWPSDSLRFIGKSGVTYGWQQTLDNYLKSYPDRAAMGKLTFRNLSMDLFGRERVYVVGEWRLDRSGDLPDLHGIYSLLWEYKDGKWVIVVDHTS